MVKYQKISKYYDHHCCYFLNDIETVNTNERKLHFISNSYNLAFNSYLIFSIKINRKIRNPKIIKRKFFEYLGLIVHDKLKIHFGQDIIKTKLTNFTSQWNMKKVNYKGQL